MDFNRIFDTTDEIFSAVIFIQLPMNTLFFALSLLQNEQVFLSIYFGELSVI